MRKLRGDTEEEIRSNLEGSRDKLMEYMKYFGKIRDGMEEELESGEEVGLIQNFYIFMANRALKAAGEAHASFEEALEMDVDDENGKKGRQRLVNEGVNALLSCEELLYPGKITEKIEKDFEIFQKGWNARARETRRLMKIEEFEESNGDEDEEVEFVKPGTIIKDDE